MTSGPGSADPILPGVLGEIEQAAGVSAALAIAEARGGTHLYVPRRVRSGHLLERLVGADAAAAIAEQLGGAEHLIPLGRDARRWQRDAEIRRRHAAGESMAEIARALHIHRRTVERVVDAPPPQALRVRPGGPDDRQLDLISWLSGDRDSCRS